MVAAAAVAGPRGLRRMRRTHRAAQTTTRTEPTLTLTLTVALTLTLTLTLTPCRTRRAASSFRTMCRYVVSRRCRWYEYANT